MISALTFFSFTLKKIMQTVYERRRLTTNQKFVMFRITKFVETRKIRKNWSLSRFTVSSFDLRNLKIRRNVKWDKVLFLSILRRIGFERRKIKRFSPFSKKQRRKFFILIIRWDLSTLVKKVISDFGRQIWFWRKSIQQPKILMKIQRI